MNYFYISQHNIHFGRFNTNILSLKHFIQLILQMSNSKRMKIDEDYQSLTITVDDEEKVYERTTIQELKQTTNITSKSYIYFRYYKYSKNKDNESLAVCKICQRSFTFQNSNSATNLTRHLKDASQSCSKELNSTEFSHSIAYNSLSGDQGSDQGDNQNNNTDRNRVIYNLLKFIIVNSLPLSVFSTSTSDKGRSFRDACASFNFEISHADGNGFSYKKLRLFLHSILMNTIQNIKEKIKNIKSKFTLVVDLSTLSFCSGMISSITLQYIGDDFEFHSIDLGIRPYDLPKQSIYLKNHIEETLNAFNIKINQINCVVADKGSENQQLSVEMGDIQYRPCICHSLHNAVCKVRDDKMFQFLFDPVNKIIKYIRSSTKRNIEFKQIQLQEDESDLNIIYNNETRWTSFFCAMVRLLNLRKTIERYINSTLIDIPVPDFDSLAYIVAIMNLLHRATIIGQSLSPSSLPAIVTHILNISHDTDILNNHDFYIPDIFGEHSIKFGETLLKCKQVKSSLFPSIAKEFMRQIHCQIKYRFLTPKEQRNNIPIEYRKIKMINHLILDNDDVCVTLGLHPVYSSLSLCNLKKIEKAAFLTEIRTKIKSKLEILQETNVTIDDSDDECDEYDIVLNTIKSESKKYAKRDDKNKWYFDIKLADLKLKQWWMNNETSQFDTIVKSYYSITCSSSAAETAFSLSNMIYSPHRQSMKPLLLYTLSFLKRNIHHIPNYSSEICNKWIEHQENENDEVECDENKINNIENDLHSSIEQDPFIHESTENIKDATNIFATSPNVKEVRNDDPVDTVDTIQITSLPAQVIDDDNYDDILI